MSEQGQPTITAQQPPQGTAEQPKKRSKASWAIRIALLVTLWLPQPILFLQELAAGTARYGFLGILNYSLVGLFLVSLSLLIIFAQPHHKPTIALGCTTLVLAAICAANFVDASGQFVDDATYDQQTANSMSENVLANNLEGGYEQYRPFTGESVIRLSKPSTLTFAAGDDLPHVDSATALLPLASALVTATYPQEATTVGWEGNIYFDDWQGGHLEGFTQCYWYANGSEGLNQETRGSFREQYESFKAGGGADYNSQAYREGYVIGWEEALAAQREGVEQDTDEYWGLASATTAISGEAHNFSSDKAMFQFNNSSSGFTSLTDGNTDVFFGTKSDADQEEYALGRGVEFEYTPVGREGFVFLVNSANPIDSLTIEQVKGIYSGRIKNWKEVGGNSEPIVAYQRNENSGSQSMMVRFMGDTPLMDPPSKMHRASSMGGLVKGIADYDNGKGAIGYSFRYYVTDLVGKHDVKLLAIEGAEPTLESIEDGSYPITGEFYAVTRKGDSNENLARFLEWVRGPQGQELVAKSGYARLSGLR